MALVMVMTLTAYAAAAWYVLMGREVSLDDASDMVGWARWCPPL